MKNQLFIISGGAGFGKTSIIKELSNLGYKTGDEYARDMIREQEEIDGDILPWEDVKAFQQEVLRKRILFYESVGENEIAFADRGIPDQLAFARFRGFSPKILLKHVEKYRYADVVFVTSPWEMIFQQDPIRKETFEEASRMHEMVCAVYDELGYKIIELPQVEISERAHFILDFVEKNYY